MIAIHTETPELRRDILDGCITTERWKRIESPGIRGCALEIFGLDMPILHASAQNGVVGRLLKDLLHFSRINFQTVLKNLVRGERSHAPNRRNSPRVVRHGNKNG